MATGIITYTRQAIETIVLMKIGSGNWAANDNHLTIGKGSGDKATWVGRAELRFAEPDWPRRGQMLDATMTVDESSTTTHSEFSGGSPRLWVKRMSERARFGLPSTADGHGSSGYTQQGQGDKYPGGAVTGDAVEFSVSGRERRDVTAIVEQQLPSRILKRNGAAGGGQLYGYYQLRSSDETSANRSLVLSRSVTLTVRIDTRVKPEAAEVLEVIGAQEDTSEPTMVASDDGQTLEVRFAFAAGPSETCRAVELELRTVGSTDGPPVTGTVIATSGNVAPLPGGGTNIYRARLTGIPKESEGVFRLRGTSSSGKQGPWTSLEEATAHVQLATIPGAPVDITVQPYVESAHIQFSLPSSHPGTITGAQAVVTLIPQGTLAWDSGMEPVGGSVRRADLTIPVTFGDGQETSTVVRLRDQDNVVGRYSAPVRQTHRVDEDVTVSPAPSRLLSRTPTITLGFPLADGAWIKLLHETDDAIEIYSSGGTPLVDQTSHGFAIPEGTLTWGQRFRVVGAYVPDGGGTTYGDFSTPVGPYSIAGLPSADVSVLEVFGDAIYDQSPTWRRTITDPDGATIAATILEIREANATPGAGNFITKYVGVPGEGDVVIPGLTLTWEQPIDVRLWARNDATALLSTQLNGGEAIGQTSIVLDSTAGMVVGSRFIIESATEHLSEEREVLTLPGGNAVTFTDPLEHAHLDNEVVTVYAPGLGAWETFDVLQPPDIDLLTPADGATITSPTQAFDWTADAFGSREMDGAELHIYDADGDILATVEVTGDTSTADAPAFLLEDATSYTWDVTGYDTEGLPTTTAQRDITTAFTPPDQLSSVTAEVEGSVGVIVSWDQVVDPELHHMEVSWQADDGTWIRIDGGPEGYGDTADPFTGASLVHIGARLGLNSYSVSAHNGWRAGQPRTATAELPWFDLPHGSWEAVPGDGELVPLMVSDAPFVTEAMIDPVHPPGSYNQIVGWGISARRISMRLSYMPATDGNLSMRLGLLMADPVRGRNARPSWIRSPAGYQLDPVWCVLASSSVTPGPGGLVDLSADWLEVGEPVHSILPAEPEPPPEGTPAIFVDVSEHDFGVVEVVE